MVWRNTYWLTDEALSTYVRSAGLFGAEMHSPILCVANGIPAIVCRWAEQTSKGFMWRDIGLGDWLFDLDQQREREQVVPAVIAMAKDPAAAKAKAEQARQYVEQRQRLARRELPDPFLVQLSHVLYGEEGKVLRLTWCPVRTVVQWGFWLPSP